MLSVLRADRERGRLSRPAELGEQTPSALATRWRLTCRPDAPPGTRQSPLPPSAWRVEPALNAEPRDEVSRDPLLRRPGPALRAAWRLDVRPEVTCRPRGGHSPGGPARTWRGVQVTLAHSCCPGRRRSGVGSRAAPGGSPEGFLGEGEGDRQSPARPGRRLAGGGRPRVHRARDCPLQTTRPPHLTTGQDQVPLRIFVPAFLWFYLFPFSPVPFTFPPPPGAVGGPPPSLNPPCSRLTCRGLDGWCPRRGGWFRKGRGGMGGAPGGQGTLGRVHSALLCGCSPCGLRGGSGPVPASKPPSAVLPCG